MSTFEFEVPGKAQGKERPRFVRRGKFVTTYTPKKTHDYEKEVAKAFKEVAKGRKLVGAVKAEISVIFEPPKSVSKKVRSKMIAGEIPHTTKGDLDNYIKVCADSVNKIAYEDDACINEIHAYKMYGERSCCQVRLTDEKHVVKPLWYIEEEGKK